MSVHPIRASLLSVLLIGALASTARAQNIVPAFAGVTFVPPASPPALASVRLRFDVLTQTDTLKAQTGTPRPTAFVYSDAYRTRLKIHRYASFATLPLFAAQAFVGQSLSTDPTDAKKTTHAILASSIGGLFAVNGVTGVWNLIEARHDPDRHTLRTVHGVLMLASSGLFFATAVTAPGSEFQNSNDGSVGVHRGLAITSIGIATTGYLIMLFGK
jgi:hypothetical protein